MTHLIYSIKKLGKTFKLQKEPLKTVMDHDEKDSSNYKNKKKNGYLLFKTMSFVLLLVTRDIVRLSKKLQDFR